MSCNEQRRAMATLTRENARYCLRMCLDNLRLNNQQRYELGMPALTARQCLNNYSEAAGESPVEPDATPGYGPRGIA